ncbi:type IVB secretion system lipoprotein DotD [Coxiella burnetii]|uniref:DotD n=1 Tax=Coxiella burnetii (strain RSA 493 / Nine Mile phase I) TaxID=227377 RepID=Q83B72_COXBU|nr:type IVB secretion system lipoprotein DotD [Coxiella burnetii]NP_820625.2 type IV secretion system protein [Coxiella burnetii RSA 493]AAO91139.2 DotD [Coxiella burnetii RSA 493]ABX78736.1 DotD protein [Coxiella burnetii RSA 331]ACJ17811.1 DotD [Coxiella burnetii CbuG_Q212]ARI66400.1 LuxR family transcriptional regulator [Coxiella burnetii]ARK27853.1 LuxR family transcriptional regulator [Coxiella burnetii]
MMKRNLLWLPLFLALPLAGCTTHKKITFTYVTTDSVPVKVTERNAQAQLSEAATSVGHSLQQMSAIQMAIHPKAKLAPPLNPGAIGMAQQTSLDWNGPIEPLLRKIASASHYRLRVLGKKPAIPVLVAINSTDVPLAEILRNATYQVEKKANITLYPSRRIIELRYYPS